MNFIITTNKELDFEMIKVFMEGGSPLIHDFWPELKTPEDIPQYVQPEYGPKMESKVQILRKEVPKLEKIANVISVVINEKWAPIDKINIWIGACPIAPRFLDINSFLMPYYHNLDYMINTSAHEMIHFLYFKKWAKLFPKHHLKNYDYPDPVWVLSEILASVIGNDPRIKDLVGSTFEVYPNWKNKEIDGENITAPFARIYEGKDSFNSFLVKSWDKYQELDKRINLTKLLTEDTF
jgi:hypothetical protein